MPKATFQPRMRLVTLPSEVVEQEVVKLGSPLFWAYDPSNNAALFTQWNTALHDVFEQTHTDQTKITANRVTSVPDNILKRVNFYPVMELTITDELIGKPTGVISTETDAFWITLKQSASKDQKQNTQS